MGFPTRPRCLNRVGDHMRVEELVHLRKPDPGGRPFSHPHPSLFLAGPFLRQFCMPLLAWNLPSKRRTVVPAVSLGGRGLRQNSSRTRERIRVGCNRRWRGSRLRRGTPSPPRSTNQVP
jgi:hypothetical protein